MQSCNITQESDENTLLLLDVVNAAERPDEERRIAATNLARELLVAYDWRYKKYFVKRLYQKGRVHSKRLRSGMMTLPAILPPAIPTLLADRDGAANLAVLARAAWTV